MDTVMVSVIVPVYNVENYLHKCVQSILSQTFSDFEVILVDDGSRDQSGEICDFWARKDPRIRVIHKINEGLASARNAGMDISRGKYLCFIDSDDYVATELLEKTVSVMEEKNCDWCAWGMVKETESGELLERICHKSRELAIGPDGARMEFLLKYLLNYRMGWEAWSHLYRGSILREHGIRFVSERKVMAEDLLFSFHYWLYAGSCVVLEDCLYHYIQRTDSLMSGNRKRNVLPYINMLIEEAQSAVHAAGLTEIAKDFGILAWHLLEWHCRPYIREYGTAWVRRELANLPGAVDGIQDLQVVERYGKVAGYVTVVVPVWKETDVQQVEHFLRMLSEQTLQKLDVLILTEQACSLEHPDITVRVVYQTKLCHREILRTGFQEAFGEYFYLADLEKPLSADTMERMSDTLKYNDCGSVICVSGQSRFVDMHSLKARHEMRQLLHSGKAFFRDAMLRADLLKKSGLGYVEDLQDYMADILLSDHMILIAREENDDGIRA